MSIEQIRQWQLAQKEYLAENGERCPLCKSDNITGGLIVKEEFYYIQEITCGGCGAEWNDVLRLVGISDLRKPHEC